MKGVITSKKFRVVIGVLILLIIGFWGIRKYQNRDIAGQPAKDNIVPAVSDFNSPSADKAISEAKNDTDAYNSLMVYGAQKASVEKYDDAYNYYEKASNIKGISQEQKEGALIGMYRAAEKLGDKGKMESSRKAMGEDAFSKYSGGSADEDEKGV